MMFSTYDCDFPSFLGHSVVKLYLNWELHMLSGNSQDNFTCHFTATNHQTSQDFFGQKLCTTRILAVASRQNFPFVALFYLSKHIFLKPRWRVIPLKTVAKKVPNSSPSLERRSPNRVFSWCVESNLIPVIGKTGVIPRLKRNQKRG